MASIVIVVIYLVDEVFARNIYTTPAWLWIAPISIFLFSCRIWVLSHRGRMTDDPVAFALRDPRQPRSRRFWLPSAFCWRCDRLFASLRRFAVGQDPRTAKCVWPVRHFLTNLMRLIAEGSAAPNHVLASGLRRSYGDSCINDGGAMIDMTGLDHFVSFDRTTGLLVAEAGVSLAEILKFAIPAGYFLPVTPGTKFVTLGGRCRQ